MGDRKAEKAKRAEYMREYRKLHPGRQYRYWKESRKRNTESRRRQRAKNYAKGLAHLTLAERATKRAYTAEEDRLILAHATPDRELAVRIRRGVRAIQIRRQRLRTAAITA